MQSTFRPVAHGAFLPAVRLAGGRNPQPYAPAAVGYAKQTFGGRAYGTPAFLGQVRLGGVQLGATAEDWYKRARASLDRYRFLKGQIATVNNEVGRATITTWLGSPSVVDSPEYRYAAVLQDFTFDASPAQEGINAYSSENSRRRSRVEKLEAFNDELNEKIEAARITYGTRTPPTQPGKDENGKPPAGPDLTWPIIGVGAAVALAVLLG